MERKRKRNAEDGDELDKFVGVLVSNCEFLISKGHNTPNLNPYKYSIRKLFSVAVVQKELSREQLFAKMYGDHLSRISCVTGDSKPFNDLMMKIAGEQ